MNFLLEGGISQLLAMGQDDGQMDDLVRSQNSLESVGDMNQLRVICRTSHRYGKVKNRLENSQFSTGGTFPVRLYLSHAAMKRPFALGHPLTLKNPSSFTQIRVNSLILLHNCVLNMADPVLFISLQRKATKQNSLCFKTHSFPLAGQRRKPKHISPSGRLHS